MSDSAELPLRGRTVIVTRPSEQAEGLCRLIDAAGGRVLRCPAVELVAIDDASITVLVDGGLRQLDVAIFVSANAVRFSFAMLRGRAAGFGWPEALPTLAVGSATARALEAEGVVRPQVPSSWDSEGLLAMPVLSRVEGRRIALFRGVGGRRLLEDTLRERGAELVVVESYRRRLPGTHRTPLLAALRQGVVDAVTVSSMEVLRNVSRLAGKTWSAALRAIPVFVPNQRVRDAAAEMGFLEPVATGVADEDVARALVAYFSAAK
jgi:uroporphyrinogen-III synthase